MATESQKAAVNKLVESGGKSVSKAMREAKLKNGKNAYSKKTAVNPSKLTKSKGFKELCEQYGLTDKLLLSSLVIDIKKKPQNRKSELELGFKIKGHMKDDNQDSLGTLADILAKNLKQRNEMGSNQKSNSRDQGDSVDD